MIRPSEGDVKVLGQAVGPYGRGPWARVGHLVETPSSYPELTVRENLEIARRLHRITEVEVTARIIEELALSSYADRKAGTLSLGNLQRLGLARALLHSPELLILDEPANHLDVAGIRALMAALMALPLGSVSASASGLAWASPPASGRQSAAARRSNGRSRPARMSPDLTDRR